MGVAAQLAERGVVDEGEVKIDERAKGALGAGFGIAAEQGEIIVHGGSLRDNRRQTENRTKPRTARMVFAGREAEGKR